MSGVIVSMRRTLLSCTSLARNGLIGLGRGGASARPRPAQAGDLSLLDAVSTLLDLNRQEIAVLTTALALLGFSVVAAILLMRTRVARRAKRGAAARRHRRPAGPGRPLPGAVVRGTADPDLLGRRRQSSADHRRHFAADAAGTQPQRILAFGTWLPPEPALQMDHAVDALREAGEGFLLNLTTSNGHAIEAMGRAIGGQAIVRIRELSGLRRELAETNLRYKALVEETEMLRDFAAAAPWPIWAKARQGQPRYANRRLCQGHRSRRRRRRDRSQPRTARQRRPRRDGAGAERQCGLHRAAADRGRRRAAHLRRACAQCRRRQRRHRHRRQRSQRAAARRWCGWRKRIAARSINCRPGVAVFDGQRRLAFYNDSYRRLWDLDRTFLDSNPDDSSVLDRLRAARKLPEQPDFRAWKAKLHEAYRAVEPTKDTWYLPDGRALSVVTTPNPEGGVTYLFDDVTESLDLARRFDGLIRVQRETLDNLAEAVAVFGSNGRAQLFNPAFARMWKLSPEALREQPHIETVEAWCRPLFDDAGTWRTHPRGDHRDREPGRGAAEAGAQGRQRAGLHDHAAARRRHHADLPGHHRHRERRARAARAQRGAGDRRPDEDRFRPPRVLRTALAADHHHRLRAFPERSRPPAR